MPSASRLKNNTAVHMVLTGLQFVKQSHYFKRTFTTDGFLRERAHWHSKHYSKKLISGNAQLAEKFMTFFFILIFLPTVLSRTGCSAPRPGLGGLLPARPLSPHWGSCHWSGGLPMWCQWQRTHLPMQKTRETGVQSLGEEAPLEEEMTTHSSILAWRIP